MANDNNQCLEWGHCREIIGKWVKIAAIERAHGVKFENKAFDLAISIARYRNEDLESIRDRLIDVLNKAGEYKAKGGNNQILMKELERRQYILRRTLLEYNQIVKDNAGSLSQVESLVAEELGEAFVELAEFVSKTMYIKHDDFVSAVHEAGRLKDYSQILDQLDAKIHDKFKQNQTVDCPQVAKIGFDLTGVPASWLHHRYSTSNEKLLIRLFQNTSVIEIIGKTLFGTSFDRYSSEGLSLFTGPNNVSKKELVRAIAVCVYYDEDEDRIVRFDMAEYTESDSTSRLVDSIASIVNTRPYSVLVLDKIEMAHPSVVDTLCRCVSSFGHEKTRDIDFEKTFIIITSDVDQVELAKKVGSNKLCEMVDDVIEVEWPSDLKDCCRILMREWALGRTNKEEAGNRPVIICPSKSALIEMETNAAAAAAAGVGNATVEGLERWMEEKVFSVLSKMVFEYDGTAGNIIIYIDREETGELSFNFE